MKRIAALFFALVLPLTAFAGAWGDRAFENDDALDWVYECTQSTGTKLLSTTLSRALNAKYLEAPNGAAVIAAAEVVAAARGKANTDFPSVLRTWLQRQPRADIAALSTLAIKVLRKVRDPKSSELKQLWSEGKSNQWESLILELESRVGG